MEHRRYRHPQTWLSLRPNKFGLSDSLFFGFSFVLERTAEEILKYSLRIVACLLIDQVLPETVFVVSDLDQLAFLLLSNLASTKPGGLEVIRDLQISEE